MRDGAGASGYDMEFVKSRRLPQLAASERRLFEEDGHGTLWVFYTHEKAWERNRTVLERRNLTVPVVKVRARNNGSHARRAIAKDFASLPPSVFLCVGLLVRLTVNLFKDAGIAWGLVNGALGTVVEVIYAPGTQPGPTTFPMVVLVRFGRYRGPTWFAADPQLVPIPWVTRAGDCCKACSRSMFPLKESEGTTIHATQGLTVGAEKPIKRIVIDLGEAKNECNARGGAYVAQSRPETAADFAYSTPVTLDRLAAIGTGKSSQVLRTELDALAVRARRTAAKYAVLAEERNFDALLQWAEGVAQSHGIVAPYLTPPALPPPPLLPVRPPPPPPNADVPDVPMPMAPSTQPGKRVAPSEPATAVPAPKQKRHLP